MKGLFEGRSVFAQLFVLLATVMAGTGVAAGVAAAMASGGMSGDPAATPVWALQLLQFLSAACVFLLPALLTARLCSGLPLRFLRIRRLPEGKLILWVTLATLTLSPAVSLTGYWNMQMHLPDTLAPLEAWMRQAEDAAAELVERFVAVEGVAAWAGNLLVIAVMAALAEECMFRGALLAILRRGIRNQHAVIWLTAVIFSAIHLQFYGFLPRMLLGAFLGYLLFLTDNLWLPVWAHFVNNAVGITAMSHDSLREHPLFTEELAPDDAGILYLAAGIGLLLFAGCAERIYRHHLSRSSPGEGET